MKKDLAEVKAYAEAMAESNRARDAYVDNTEGRGGVTQGVNQEFIESF